MGKNKTKTKKFAEVKRILNPKEARVDKGKQKKKKRDDAPEVKHVCVRVRGYADRPRRNLLPSLSPRSVDDRFIPPRDP